MPSSIFTDREAARQYLTESIAHQRRAMADPRDFCTYPRDLLLADSEWRLRWLDCAPDGANHQLAPLQDKTGTPNGGAYNENVGDSQALRNARARRGLNPNDPTHGLARSV